MNERSLFWTPTLRKHDVIWMQFWGESVKPLSGPPDWKYCTEARQRLPGIAERFLRNPDLPQIGSPSLSRPTQGRDGSFRITQIHWTQDTCITIPLVMSARVC